MAIGMVMVTKDGIGCRGGCTKGSTKSAAEQEQEEEERNNNNNLSIIEMLLAALRKSMVSCRVDRRGEEPMSALRPMEIGWPTDVQHVAHVTFDRFEGFQGLPVEFEVEIPSKVPSASASVFGVSAESMQCSYDSRGNSVPIILLLMQDRLYTQGGLKAEGIFRINPENSHEEDVRSQLNRGIVPDDINVHCLAALIKAWFRELPSGVLDGLSPEQVLECSTEEEFVELVKELQPTESALLHWVIDLMADVVQLEESNKMNARNIAVVFAPNMTQMSDPLTALMHAVQIMNLLKTLIMKTLREREEAATAVYSPMSSHSSDGEIESQREMDTSCELRGLLSQCDGNSPYSNGFEDGDEIESLSDTQECLLGQFDAKENAKIPEESIGDRLRRHHVSARSGSTSYMESGVSLSDGKLESSCLSTSDGECSGAYSIAVGVKDDLEIREKLHENMDDDVEMVSKFESATPIPWFGIH